MTEKVRQDDATFCEIHRLTTMCLEGDAPTGACDLLRDLILDDPESLDLYVHYLSDSISLRCVVASPVDSEAMALALSGETPFDISASLPAVLPPQDLSLTFGPSSPASCNTFGYFTSGWPVAYLVATVVFGIGLAIGAMVHVSQPGSYVGLSVRSSNRQSPIPDPSLIVGRITGMAECKWVSDLPSPDSGREAGHQGSLQLRSPVRLHNRLALKSGLMEITYDTGAKVILQGPVTYEVESKNGGFLSSGKLTGKVEVEKARGFIIRTPTATVTDLGTEFGVEVGTSGVTEAHVFVGTVKVAGRSSRNGGAKPHILHAGGAVRVDGTNNQIIAISSSDRQFVRDLPQYAGSPRNDAYAELVLSMEPFAYYRMERSRDKKNRDVVFDSAPGGHHGALCSLDTSTPSDLWSSGCFGNSVYLRGPAYGDYVSVSDFPTSKSNQLSVSAWVYAYLAAPSFTKIASQEGFSGTEVPGDSKDPAWQFTFGLHGAGGDLWAAVNQRNGRCIRLREGQSHPLPRGRWQHVAFTADGSVLHLYRNGVELASTPCDGVAITPPIGRFVIGGMNPLEPSASSDDTKMLCFWQGRIDELAVFHHALSASQMRMLFEGPHRKPPQEGRYGTARP